MLFELVFVGYLLRSLDKAEMDVDRATNAKMAASAASRILGLFYDAGASLGTFKATNNPILLAKYSQAVNTIPGQLELLQGALENQKDGPERFRRASLLCERSIDLLDRCKRRAELGEGAFPYDGALPMTARLDVMSKELVAEMSSLVKEYESSGHSMESALASRKQLRYLIFGGTALSVVLAVALALSFTNGTVRRLSVLMRNTKSLERKEPIMHRVTGKDEIAQLDDVFHEVSEKLAEAESERLKIEQLKREFLNMITHDLRSPLASVTTAIDVLNAGLYGELSDQGRASLALTGSSLNYMTRLVDDLLDCERLEAGQFPLDCAPQDLGGIAESAVASVRSLAAARGIHIDLGECGEEVFADETRLQQVLTNLLHNAIKYSPDGGKIKVDFLSEGETVETRITDQGPGIPSELQTRIFERFKQISIDDAKVKRGSGLGLYFCKQVIELQSGTIGINSSAGAGSTFWFRLPIYHEPIVP